MEVPCLNYSLWGAPLSACVPASMLGFSSLENLSRHPSAVHSLEPFARGAKPVKGRRLPSGLP